MREVSRERVGNFQEDTKHKIRDCRKVRELDTERSFPRQNQIQHNMIITQKIEQRDFRIEPISKRESRTLRSIPHDKG